MRFVSLFIFALYSFQTTAEVDIKQIEKYEEFDNWLYDAFKVPEPNSEFGILKLGKPKSIDRQNYSVGHSNKPLESVIYRFDGLTIHAIIEKTDYKRAYITQVTINSSRWLLESGIGVGQNPSVLLKLSVKPHTGTYNYCGTANCIEFQIKENKIKQLQITLYVD